MAGRTDGLLSGVDAHSAGVNTVDWWRQRHLSNIATLVNIVTLVNFVDWWGQRHLSNIVTLVNTVTLVNFVDRWGQRSLVRSCVC